MVYERPMDDVQKKGKNLIGKGEFVGLVCGSGKRGHKAHREVVTHT